MREFSRLGLVGAIVMLGIAQADADTLGVDLSTVSSTAATDGITYGYEFTVGSVPIEVTALGTFDDGSISNLGSGLVGVGIWECSGGPSTCSTATLVRERAVTTADAFSGGEDDLWAFVELAQPLTLAANTTYIIASEGANQLYTGQYSLSDVTINPLITFDGDVSSTTATFGLPTISDGCSDSSCPVGYFGGNFIDPAVPEPMSLSLFGFGLAGLGLIRRRMRG